MPMILVKKNPRGKVIRELSSEEETAVKTVCGLKRPATMAQHNLANDLLREMREYDAWLQCDCIPGDSPAMNFAALKNNTGTLYLSSFNHEHAPECPMYRQLSGNEEETSFGASRHPVSTRINYRNFLPPDDSNSVIRLQARSAYHNGERSSVRKKRPRLGRLLLSLIEDAGLNKLDSLANPRIRTNYRECLDAIRQVTLQQEYIRGRALSEIGFAPIFPDICYHLTHYKPAAADIPVASDNPAHYADAIRYNARTPLQGSLLPLTRLVWA